MEFALPYRFPSTLGSVGWSFNPTPHQEFIFEDDIQELDRSGNDGYPASAIPQTWERNAVVGAPAFVYAKCQLSHHQRLSDRRRVIITQAGPPEPVVSNHHQPEGGFILESPTTACLSTCSAKRTNSGPTAEEWEKMKPIISELYIDRNLCLQDVQKIMIRKHGFRGSTKMYKKKFDKWKLWKHYRRSQKEAISAVLPHVDSNSNIVINGKPLVKSRIERYLRQKKKFPASIKTRKASPTIGRPQRVHNVSHVQSATSHEVVRANFRSRQPPRYTPVQTVFLIQSEEFLCVEEILADARYYFNWRLTKGREYLLDTNDTYIELYNQLVNGLSAVSERRLGRKMGWKLLDAFCANLLMVIPSQPIDLLVDTLCLLRCYAWQNDDGVAPSLLRYISEAAQLALGHNHPLTNILRLTCCGEVLAHMVEPFLLLSSEPTPVTGHSSDFVGNSSRQLASFYSYVKNDFESAAATLKRLLRHTEQQYGRSHRRTRKTLRLYAVIFEEEGDVETAESLLLESFGLGEEDLGVHNSDTIDADICFNLATLYWDQDKYEQCEFYCQLAFKRYLELVARNDANVFDFNNSPDCIDSLELLELVFRTLGKEQEADQLREDYAYLWLIAEED